MKLNYWVGGFVIVVILLSNSLALTQTGESSNNPKRVNESQPTYVIGLRKNAAPISYRIGDPDNDQFGGYCYAFIETLKQRITGNIKTVLAPREKRFTGQGDGGKKLDALCGPDTITAGREATELQKNDLDGKFSNPFAWTSIAALLEKKNKDTFLYPPSPRDLKISVLTATTTYEVVKALYPSLFFDKKIYNSNNFEDAINRLTKGDVIAYFDDEILLRDRLKKISSNPQEKEYIILPLPSIIEYGIIVFHTKEKKNQKLLEVINNLLENAPQKKFDSTTIKILNENADFQNFINSVKANNLLEPTPTPILNPTPTPTPILNPTPTPTPILNPTFLQGYLWLLVFCLIIIILIIIWLYRNKIRAKRNRPVSPIPTPSNDKLNHQNSSYFDKLDLYHNKSVDPRAIAISFKQLAEKHPDAELEIVAMEKQGQDKFLLRAKTAAKADKSQLSAEYFDTYNEIKSLPEQEIKSLLAEKDNQIRRLENMVMTALERPSFYAGNYTNQGNTMSQSSKKESNFNLQNAQFGGGLVNADTVNAEQIGGDITNYGQQQQKEAQTETNNSAVKTILILASNPKNTSHLRLDEEVRGIDSGLQRAKKQELFDLKQRWAVRVQEVYQALLDFKPQIIHFSGHGAGEHGLVLEDDTGNLKLVDTEALAQLFELFSSTIECVVLNACYSEVQAGAIAKHIPYVIGMNQEIGDKAAIKFATGFYNALGTGESVEFAYKLGCNVIQLDGIPEHLTPVLKKKQ